MQRVKPYPPSLRESVLKQVLKQDRPLTVVAAENGIPYNRAWAWVRAARKKAEAGGSASAEGGKRPADFSPAERYALLVEAAKLSEEELGAFLRRHGLFSSTLDEWREAALGGLSHRPEPARDRKEEQRIRALERELERKDRALAEVGALLVLRKKVEALWEDEERDVSPSAERKSSR